MKCRGPFARREGDVMRSKKKLVNPFKPTAGMTPPVLIGRQVIEATAPGYVAFSMPFMRECLLERKGEILARYGG